MAGRCEKILEIFIAKWDGCSLKRTVNSLPYLCTLVNKIWIFTLNSHFFRFSVLFNLSISDAIDVIVGIIKRFLKGFFSELKILIEPLLQPTDIT